VGPRAGLDAVLRRKITSPYRTSNPQSSIPLRYAIQITQFRKTDWNFVCSTCNVDQKKKNALVFTSRQRRVNFRTVSENMKEKNLNSYVECNNAYVF
jgi:hypothetical protein